MHLNASSARFQDINVLNVWSCKIYGKVNEYNIRSDAIQWQISTSKNNSMDFYASTHRFGEIKIWNVLTLII